MCYDNIEQYINKIKVVNAEMVGIHIANFSNRARLRRAIEGKDVILRGVSALEYMEKFVGYMAETDVEVYTKEENIGESFDIRVLECFESIDYFQDGHVRCATFNQVVNDMLSEFDTMDDVALAEALSEYYEETGSFEGLNIEPQYMGNFIEMMDWAREYHYGG